MIKRKMLIPGGSLGEIYGVSTLPERAEKVPLILLSHGFGGEHGFNQDYADAFTERGGFATFNFDFCGGGPGSKSGGTMEEMSVLTEAQDLLSVLRYFREEQGFSEICLWGESQGGFVSSYLAGKHPELVSKLVLLYPAFVLQEDAEKRRLADGTFGERSSFGGHVISRKYNEDAVSFDIYEVIRAFRGPALIIHGDSDPVVPYAFSERAVRVMQKGELMILPGAGHGFAGKDRETATERALAFFGDTGSSL